MPADAMRLSPPTDRVFTEEEYQRMSRGLVPQVMEDRWFIFLEGDWLYFHRSWTCLCVYQARLERAGDSYRIAEASANPEALPYYSTDEGYHRESLVFLIDALLLGKPVPSPRFRKGGPRPEGN
jgi:hypothetical protein